MTTTKKTKRAGVAHSAPDRPPTAPTAPSADPPRDGATAAVWAALTANPGATAAQLAVAAGTNRAIAGRELAALETAGRATRTTARRGAPASWQAAMAAETLPGADSAHPGTGQAAAEDSPAEASAPPVGADEPGAADRAAPEPGRPDAIGGPHTADGPADAEGRPAPGDAESIDIEGEITGAAADGGGPDGTEPADIAESEKAAAEPPAEWTQALELLAELAGAADHATAALRRGDTAAAVAAADAAYDRAAQARRTLRSAVTGRKARSSGESSRPGQLRDLVRGHLAAYPDAEFTPHAVGRVLGRSSGAVANALDRLTALGQAQLTSEHPRKYKAIAAEAAHSYLAA
jgi:hypothetical protein